MKNTHKKVYTINEFASLSGVEPSKLRYWEKSGVFMPAVRDKSTGYRRYSTAQLPALNFVSVLSTIGVPLSRIAALRNKRNPAELLELLQGLETTLDMEMRSLRLRYSMIHARREMITMGMKANEKKISVMHLDALNMIVWPRNSYNPDDTFIEPLTDHIQATYDLRINLKFPVAGLHDDMDSFVNAPGRPDNFLSIDPEGTHIRLPGNYLVGYARGYYGEVGDLPIRIKNYAGKHSIKLDGPVYTMYLFEEICTDDTSQYLACCSVAIAE